MIEQMIKAIFEVPLFPPLTYRVRMAKAAIKAALPHIKEAMEYNGVEGAMNKLIIDRLKEKANENG